MADQDGVVLVSSTTWCSVRAEGGYHEIDSRKAIWILENLDRRRWLEMRRFVAEARLGNFALNRMDDHEVLKLIHDAIRDGRVIAVQKGTAKSDSPSATVELRRLLAQVEKATRGKLSYRGRQYKLVVDVDLAKIPGRDYYEVVGQDDARAVLDGVAKELDAPAELLKQASEKLSKDWHGSSSHPEGLVLLRRIPVQATVPKEEGPAITPSQMKAMMEAANREKGPLWIRIDIPPEQAQQAGARFVLTSSDRSVTMTQTVQDDMEPGNETIDLLYDDLWKDLSYSLRIEEDGGLTEIIFDNAPYGQLVSLIGVNQADDSSGNELDIKDMEAVRPSSWAGISPFDNDQEDA
jgi:hypothetical protein